MVCDRRGFVLQLQEGGWDRLEGYRLVSLRYSDSIFSNRPFLLSPSPLYSSPLNDLKTAMSLPPLFLTPLLPLRQRDRSVINDTDTGSFPCFSVFPITSPLFFPAFICCSLSRRSTLPNYRFRISDTSTPNNNAAEDLIMQVLPQTQIRR